MIKFRCLVFLLYFSLISISLSFPTLHAQSCGGEILVGDNDTLSSTGDLSPNVWKSLQFTAHTSGTASCFKVFLKDLPNPPNHLHNLGYALFTNNPSARGGCGDPGTLIAYGTRPNYNWSIIGTSQWHEFPLTQTAHVTEGTLYWVAFCSDGGHDGWHFGRASEQLAPRHAERKRGCNTHSWNNIPNGGEWNIVYPGQNSPCADNGTYSWHFATRPNANSTTSTNPIITTSVTPSTTTTAGTIITTSINGSSTTTSTNANDLTLNFKVDKKFGFTPLPVQFTNLCTGPITNYQWDFGDGSTSTEKDPIHTYTDVGIFTVKLSAYSLDGNIEIKTNSNLIVALLGCPIATILDNHENLTTLRTFRNHMLKNFFGFLLVSLYYQNSDEIFKILINNPDLTNSLDSFLCYNMHIPEEILHGNKPLLTENTLQEIINYLEQLKKHSSNPFTEDLNIVIRALRNKTILSELGLTLQ